MIADCLLEKQLCVDAVILSGSSGPEIQELLLLPIFCAFLPLIQTLVAPFIVPLPFN
jgi:hypothetical protein